MEIKKFVKVKDNKYKVIIDDENTITLYDDVIVKYNLLVNKKMDINMFNEIISYNNELESYYKAIRYINKKLRSKKEIIKYLEKDYESKVINKTIKKLNDDGYLNDEIYIKAYINDQINLSLNGPYKIKRELSKLGLEEALISKELDTIIEDIWESRIEKYIDKKIKTNHTNSNKKLKEKIVYELINLGYSKDVINLVFEEIEIPIDFNIVIKEGDKIYNKLSRKFDGDTILFQIKNKLYQKGYSEEEINYYLDIKKVDS